MKFNELKKIEISKTSEKIILFLTIICSLVIILSVYSIQNDYFYVTQREPQTAITSYYMIHDHTGPIHYITPILGYPWAIPFEFPLYQYITALLSNTGLPLNDTGRTVSLLFFLATLFLLFKILKRFEIPTPQVFLFLALVASSPIYLSYSFTFTIETTALFFSVLYLYLYIMYYQERRFLFVIPTILIGIAAAMVKVTTWVVFGGVIGLVLAGEAIKQLKAKRIQLKELSLHALSIVLPLISAYGWTQYADSVKMKNPFGVYAVSSQLSEWTYGTLAQKLSISQWIYYCARSLSGVLGIMGLLIPVFLVYRFIKKRRATNQNASIDNAKGTDKKAGKKYDIRMILLAVIAFFIGPVIFTNIFFQHDYYVIPGGLFLIFAIFLLLKDHVGKWVFVLLIISNLLTGYFYLYLKQVNYYNPLNRHIVETIREMPGDHTIIVFGADYDSFIPYYSNKKALQTRVTDFSDPTFQQALINMKDRNVGLIVVKTAEYEDIAVSCAKVLGISEKFEMGSGAAIYYRPGVAAHLHLKTIDTNYMADTRIKEFLTQFNQDGQRMIININKKNLVSVMYYNGSNFYMFDFKNGFQILDHKRYNLTKRDVKLEIKDKIM